MMKKKEVKNKTRINEEIQKNKEKRKKKAERIN